MLYRYKAVSWSSLSEFCISSDDLSWIGNGSLAQLLKFCSYRTFHSILATAMWQKQGYRKLLVDLRETNWQITSLLCATSYFRDRLAATFRPPNIARKSQGKWTCWKVSAQRCDSIATMQFERCHWGCRTKLSKKVVVDRCTAVARLIWNRFNLCNVTTQGSSATIP